MAALIDEYKQAIQDVLDGRAKEAPRPSELPWTEDKLASMWAAAAAELIAEANSGGSSGGGVLLVNATVSGKRVNLDKTWQEINDSTLAVVKMNGMIMRFYMTGVTDESYNVVVGMPNILDGQIVFAEQTFSTTTASGYPFLIMS